METVAYLLLWAVLFFIMMRFGCGAHIMGHRHHAHHAHHAPNGEEREHRWATPAQARDPVCGMTVATASAKPSVYDGRAYYFCSQQCRETFEASPERYVGDTPAVEAKGA